MTLSEKMKKYEVFKKRSLNEPKLNKPRDRERFLKEIRKKLGLIDDEFNFERGREKLHVKDDFDR